jgi:hypothetical protein
VCVRARAHARLRVCVRACMCMGACVQVDTTWDEEPEAPAGYRIVANIDDVPSCLVSRKIMYAWDTESVRGWFVGETANENTTASDVRASGGNGGGVGERGRVMWEM